MMQELFNNNYFIGFFVFIVTTVANSFTGRYIKPKLRNLFSDEPRISGRWKSTFIEDKQEYVEDLELEQKGRIITGSISLMYDDKQYRYNLRGEFRHLILTCTFESVDNDDIERGVIFMKYIDKCALDGWQGHFSNDSKNLVSSKYSMKKVS